MARSPVRKPPKPPHAPQKQPVSRFVPSAFLSGDPQSVAQLSQALADLGAKRFLEAIDTPWPDVGRRFAEYLRSLGHDLTCFDENPTSQEWTAEWHHPRGLFTLNLTFNAPSGVVVSWTSDAGEIVARAGE